MKIRKYASIEKDGYFQIYEKDGTPVCQCASIGDAKMMLSLVEGRTLRKVSIIEPETVDVSYIAEEPDKQLEPQNILPESQQEPLQL
jgi:hypothetical protein